MPDFSPPSFTQQRIFENIQTKPPVLFNTDNLWPTTETTFD